LLRAGAATAHKAKGAPVAPRHHFKDNAGFAVFSASENEAFIMPFHG
jgi:hypothetical protein